MHQQKHYGVYFKRVYGLVPRILIYFAQKQPPGVFCKKGVLRNFAKPTENHLCQRPFFNKVAGLGTVFFFVNFAKFLRTSFLQSTSGFAYIFLFLWYPFYINLMANVERFIYQVTLLLSLKCTPLLSFTFVFCQN